MSFVAWPLIIDGVGKKCVKAKTYQVWLANL